jgi:YidC/Oxa1 family membrane protein insertase
MSWFDIIVVQPIFNLLMGIYAIIPGNDFGIAVIILAIIVRLAMWPLIKKQLHQTKLQRAIQPELKKIKQKAAGNKQLEGQLMLELYRERGINPFAPIGVLIVQLPIFIALYQMIMMISNHRERLEEFFYEFMKQFDSIAAIIADPSTLNETFLQVIDLTKPVHQNGEWYIPALIIAIIATAFQWYQSKQITPQAENGKRLRDILRNTAKTGQAADQSEVTAAMSNGMLKIIPVIALGSMILIPIPGALLLFYAASSIVAVIQQRKVLTEDVEEMEAIAAKPDNSEKPAKKGKGNKKASTKKRAEEAAEAEVVVRDDNPNRKVKKPVQKRRKGSKVR